jgi:hypothetical protein
VGAFQITPISPGSLVRGFYVLYLVVRERNFKDYNIAVFMGFMKYIGYLAFPIQMAYRYPVLARFMAAHWATGAVHAVPVFGEHGALLEHFVFDLFYNYPLTVRRKMRLRAEMRASKQPRTWHFSLLVFAGGALMAAVECIYRSSHGALPDLVDVWPAVVIIPALLGALGAIGAGGMQVGRRIRLSLIAAVDAGVLSGLVHAALAVVPTLGGSWSAHWAADALFKQASWGVFIFAVLATVAAVLAEVLAPEPKHSADQASSQ